MELDSLRSNAVFSAGTVAVGFQIAITLATYHPGYGILKVTAAAMCVTHVALRMQPPHLHVRNSLRT